MSKKNTINKLTNADFVHLHNHTQYSLLDGLTKIPELIDRIADGGMKAIAMTDHGTLSGAIEFYKTAKKGSVKPIIGMEAYVAPREHTDKDPSRDKQYYHLTILAMNNQGYDNLMKLSTIACLDGFYYKPRIDHQLLEKYGEGLIVLSGCINSEVGSALDQGQYKQARDTASWYKQILQDRYYIEIQDHGHPKHPTSWVRQTNVNKLAFRLADELEVKTVITGDAHYLKKEDQEAHEILLCVQTGSFLSDENRMSLKDLELYVSSAEDIIGRWGEAHSESIINTSEIAKKCNVELSLGKILIPKYPVPKGYTESMMLREMVYQGLAWRYGAVKKTDTKNIKPEELRKKISDEIITRAEYELSVIDKMSFNGYFLIIADFVNWGKDRGIVFGPGRGSAAGSIIAYALNITELDPLAYDLLFERFLNPDRISMPDIDIDIQDSRRNEVIEYCIEKYGEDRVANIVTFGRMAARNAVRDVARVLQVPYAEADRLAKMIPPPVQGRHIPLKKSLVDDENLAEEYKNSPKSKEVFDLAVRLEGTIRSHGVHAAGVVIAPDIITNFTPLEMAQKGVIATQYSMGPVEEIGLLKIDFLGLSNLTIIKNALRIIKKVYGKDIDISNIPLDDEKTYGLFQRGDTIGVFQLESSGMKRYLKELKPTVFEDIIAMVALYRPGPLTAGLTDEFIARKNGRKQVVYDHELMKNSLKNTYGVLVYQEQVMQIAKEMCGFSGGEADTLRKAVGKKIREMMIEQKDKIISGAIKNGVEKRVAEKFWTDLEGFADYAFNKSHAACYGLIAYWTAYLKAHFPVAFLAALMTSDFDDTDHLAIDITECRSNGIDVLPPDVNESFLEFAVIYGNKKESIRFGMNAIKNVGKGAVDEIIRVREESGKFKNIQDFLYRVEPRVVNRKTLESLIKAGAMDCFEERSTLIANLDLLTSYSARVHKEKSSNQMGLFEDSHENTSFAELTLVPASLEFPLRTQLVWERELLGLYLSSHPLEEYKLFLEENTHSIGDLSVEMEGKKTKVGGSITEFREIKTKKGQSMAFVKIADIANEVELIIFPDVYQKTVGIWQKDMVLLVTGRINRDNRNGSDEVKIIVEDAREITHEQATSYKSTGKKPNVPKISKTTKTSVANNKDRVEQVAFSTEKRIYVRIGESDEKKLVKLKTVIDLHPGKVPVVLVIGAEQKKQIIRLPNMVDAKETLLNGVKEIFGQEFVKYQ